MDGTDANKKYDSYRIPPRRQSQVGGVVQPPPRVAPEMVTDPAAGMYYEIEYDAAPFPGVGKFALKPQKIDAPEKDEIRDLFVRMRNIAREYQSSYDFFRFFDRRVHGDNARIFYQQGLMMRDFADDYEENVELSLYFPSYQMMGYKQLRTYFTWRAQVRRGNVVATSPSYAFLYIYELLGNIGVADPHAGLASLFAFWQTFRAYNNVIDGYVLRWLKDYHVYYQLTHSWAEFVEKHGLEQHYPEIAETEDSFASYNALSKYKIKQSPFYTDETSELIADCLPFVMDRIKRDLAAAGIDSDDALLRPAKGLVVWKPFKDAIFHDWLPQPDRRVVLAGNEVYECKNNEWLFNTVVVSEKGKRFIGYIMKQTEAALRKVTKYKYKISAKLSMIDEDTLETLKGARLSIERMVTDAVIEYYREATKTVVTVEQSTLARIRQEALITQEALTIEEQARPLAITPTLPPAQTQNVFAGAEGSRLSLPPVNATNNDAEIRMSELGSSGFSAPLNGRTQPAPTPNEQFLCHDVAPVSDPGKRLKDVLNESELRALALLLQDGDLKALADAQGVMLEVLVDGINQKALDYTGDNLLDEEFRLYDEYREQVKELIE